MYKAPPPLSENWRTERWSERRDFLRQGSMALIGAALGGCGAKSGGADSGPELLRAATIGKGEGDARLLLDTAGIHTEGFRVEYSVFASSQLAIEAFDGGALDYSSMSEITAVFAAASTVHSFRQIAVLHGDVNNQAVVVPKGSAIHDLADLKGKRVGYVRASTSQYILIRMLESVGLTWADIVPTAMSVADGLTAFSSGTLDAWAIYGYPIQRVMATEGASILRTGVGFLSGNYTIAVHVDDLADPRRTDLIGRYLRVVKHGYAWATAHPAQWAGVVAKEIGVPLAYVKDAINRRSDSYTLRPVDAAAIASQQHVADIFARQGFIRTPVDMRPMWVDRFNSIILEPL